MQTLRNPIPVLVIALATLAVLALTGCARSVTNQRDFSATTHVYDLDPATGRTNRVTVTENRETTTRASASAAVSSSQTFKGLNASQDGRNQGLKIDEASQKSDVDQAINVIGKLGGVIGSLYGIPTGPAAAAPGVGYAAPPGAAPPGKKWTLQHVDNPSTPKPEVEP